MAELLYCNHYSGLFFLFAPVWDFTNKLCVAAQENNCKSMGRDVATPKRA